MNISKEVRKGRLDQEKERERERRRGGGGGGGITEASTEMHTSEDESFGGGQRGCSGVEGDLTSSLVLGRSGLETQRRSMRIQRRLLHRKLQF